MKLFSKSDEIICTEFVRKEMAKKRVTVNDAILKEIVQDIIYITYAKGGGTRDIFQSFAKAYIERGLYKKILREK